MSDLISVLCGRTESDKQRRQRELDALAYRTLLSWYRGPERWVQWSEWFDLVKARRGKLGNDTFNDAVKRLLAQERVRKNFEGLYQVVLGSVAPDYTEVLTPHVAVSSGVPFSPRNTPKRRVTLTKNGTDNGSVVLDKAALALEHLLNKKARDVV